ncbi:MAG: hypothetical protein COA86_13015 [Kangiella sp.]|nr:MAG: hypothetical protein COA86_13015 [Kangiella sp.]
MKIKHTLLSILLFIPILLSFVHASTEQVPVETVTPFTDGELEQILAPIALYPDTVLTHVLIASTYPLEVIQAERWTGENPDVLATDAVKSVEEKDWDPSVKALVAFPEILQRLSKNLDWTQKLGDAFLADEERLLASIQALRQRAYEIGSLDKMDKMKVSKDENNIVIEPIETQVVYVPYYDTRVVYGPWHWAHYPPVYWHYPSHYAHFSHNSRHHSPFYWGPRVHISFGFFFSSFHWHNRHVVRIPTHHYRPYAHHSRREVIRHEHANRWRHNPTHRRGVSYRSVTVSNRYASNRASQTEIRSHRTRTDNQVSRTNQSNRRNQTTHTTRRNDSVRANSNNTRSGNNNNRIRNNRPEVTRDRIQRELRDGRITVNERNNRNVERTVERNIQRRTEPTAPPIKINQNVRTEPTQTRERASSRTSPRSNSRSNTRSNSRQNSSSNNRSSNRSSNKQSKGRSNKRER